MSTLVRLPDALNHNLVRWLVPIMLVFGLAQPLAAQLSGTYTIDPSGSGVTNYTSIENAITALNGSGVSGAVTFRIANGTITPPTGGYTLAAVTGMSATNTVTFKPAASSTVIIDGTLASPIFNINGGDFYILDGSNSAGGTSRDWTIINRNTANPTIQFINGATFNVARNLIVMGSATSGTVGIFRFSTSSVGGNSNNLVTANTIGDVAGTVRASTGVYMAGSSGTNINSANMIDNNDIVNYANAGNTSFGVHINTGNEVNKIFRNRITIPVKGTTTGQSVGIRFSNQTDARIDTIAYNKIWDISTSGTATQYGVENYFGTTNASLSIHDNMISLTGNSGTLAGLYSWPSNAAIVYFDYNSVSITGTNTSASTTSYGVYAADPETVNIRNNVLQNTRTSTGTNTNVLIYRSSTGTTVNSNYNVLYNNGASTAIGYWAGATPTTYTTLPTWRSATTQDANSLPANPRFINPATGDLHISTSLPTPVEGYATPISGLTSDFDGNTRNATTPDIGADEGNFIALLLNDLAAVSFNTPLNNAVILAGTAFSPVATVTNAGLNAQTSVPIRYRIRNASNTIVYEDVQNVSFAALQTQQVTFNQTGNVSGSTVLTNGIYSIELRTELSTDQSTSSDVITGTITALSPLCGAYTIDPNGTGGRNYTSFTAAISDLNQVGVSCAVTFTIAGGTYNVTRETFPLRIAQFPGTGATNRVMFKPAAGASVTIDGTVANPVLDFGGADYVTFDGSNSANGTSRNLTIINRNTGSPTVRFIDGATNDVVSNTILIGSATSNTVGIVQFSTSTVAGGNSNNTLLNNSIGDPTGAIRSATGIFALGSAGTNLNNSNIIDGNDIQNFGVGTADAFGIHTRTGNNRLKILRNQIHIPVKTGVTGTSIGFRIDNNVDNQLDTFAFNRIWDLTTSGSNLQYGIETYYLTSGQTLVIHNNMIALESASGLLRGLYLWPVTASTTYVHHNSIYIGGSGTSSESYAIWMQDGVTNDLRNNVLVNTRATTGSTLSFLLNRNATTTIVTSNYNDLYVSGTGTAIGKNAGTNYITLADWITTGYDVNSVSGPVPFINPSTGNLHLNPQPVFLGESRGTALGYPLDFDQETRSQIYPDMGADEGEFNGGGIRVVFPNGGESVPVNFQLPVQFTTNRPMSVQVQISTNNGTTWIAGGSVDPTNAGTNTLIISTPDSVVSTALVRIISQRNQWESDTSDRTFSLVRPVLTLITPNGGERYIPTDTNRIRWTSEFLPPSLTVALEYSTNGGNSWLPIASNLSSSNLPGTNFYDWITPNTPTTNAIVRVVIPNSSAKDASDNVFTIAPQPQITVLSPNGGDGLFVGEKHTIRWSSSTIDFVKIEYSVDDGATWNLVYDRVPAYLGSYDWTVPNNETTRALVRITSLERPRFTDKSDATFSIVRGELTLTFPNGGEQFELGQPITVRWASRNSTTLRLEYSADNGESWKLIEGSIPAANGSQTFTPPEVPTKFALVRLTDVNRTEVQDKSDKVFEIRASKSIIIYAPGEGDELLRGSTYTIMFEANRITNVTIQYSSNGGTSWSTLVSNISAGPGIYLWNVPNQVTNNGYIRILEIGGTTIGMSGRFSIVDAVVSSIQIVSPNGGESFTEGDPLPIRWTASPDLISARIDYSSDGGATWTNITPSTSASAGVYNWTAPAVPGTRYRVRITSSTVTDLSDADFEVVKKLNPAITVTRPNGGEDFNVGDVEQITWNETDITAPQVKLEYSTDNGTSWTQIQMVNSGTLSYDWTVEDKPTTQALIRVSAGATADVSNANFTISKNIVRTLDLASPNGGEIWTEDEVKPIIWTSSGLVSGDNVRLRYSTDFGVSWDDIVASTPAAAGTYNWTIPADTTTALVDIMLVGDPSVNDKSQTQFTIRPKVVGSVGYDLTGATVMRLLGNFPNPFASTTTLRWLQVKSGEVVVKIYDGTGRIVGQVDVGRRESGEQTIELRAGELPSGIYQYELLSGTAVARGAMMIVR